jgi:RHS repeat-associated protein
MTMTSQLSENSHQGFDGIKAGLCLASTRVNSNTASGMPLCLWRNGIRSRSTGKERDVETGLDYFDARYMSAAQGRFTSTDPVSGQISNPQSFNAYSYAWNNPLKYTDPTGMVVSWEDSKKGRDGYTNNQRIYFNKMTKLLRSKNKKDRDIGARMKSNYDRLNQSDVIFHVIKDSDYGDNSGMLEYRGNPGNVFISLKGDATAYGALSVLQKLRHEFEHGEQFLDGELGFIKGKGGKWWGYCDDRVDEANAFIAGFEVEGIAPGQMHNKLIAAISQAMPFGLQAVVDALGKVGMYQGLPGVEIVVTKKDMLNPNVYAIPKY